MRQSDPAWWAGGSYQGRPLQNALNQRDIGFVFRFLKSRGWSRAAIAAATGLAETRVRAIAQGTQRITSFDVLERIADGLHIDRGMLGVAFTTNPASGPRHAPDAVEAVPVPGLDTIRAVLDTAGLPSDGSLRPVSALSTEVARAVRLRLSSNYARLSALVPDLLNDLHRAYGAAAGQRRTAVAGLLVQAYRAADALADKSGHHDLSARIIAMMGQAAAESGDELLRATAAYVHGELFFTNGRPDLGRTLLERAAERLLPGLDVGSSAAYGSLHMRAAVLAGQAGDLARARDHLAEATTYAALLEEGEYCGTAFGPSSVRIHQITLAVDTDDVDTAIRAAQGWDPPEDLPGERRSHFYVDLARAHLKLDAVDATVTALFQARAVAPEHTRGHQQVREMITTLVADGRATSQVRELARWVGAAP